MKKLFYTTHPSTDSQTHMEMTGNWSPCRRQLRLRNLLIEGRIVILLRVVNIIRDLTMYPSSVQLRILLDVGQSPALSSPAAPLAACVQRISCNFLSYVNAMSPELNSVDKANKNKLLRQHPLRDRKLISD